MKQFIKQNEEKINLIRTRLMLKLTKEQIIKVNQKEALERNIIRNEEKRRQEALEIGVTNNNNAIKVNQKKALETDGIKHDHLPFQKFNHRIACLLPDCEPRPSLEIELT